MPGNHLFPLALLGHKEKVHAAHACFAHAATAVTAHGLAQKVVVLGFLLAGWPDAVAIGVIVAPCSSMPALMAS